MLFSYMNLKQEVRRLSQDEKTALLVELREYNTLHEEQKMSGKMERKEKLRKAEMLDKMDCVKTIGYPLDCYATTVTEVQSVSVPCWGASCINNKKENTMRIDSYDGDLPTTQKNYLLSRASTVREERKEALKVQFGLADEAFPKTLREFVERIQAGSIVLPKDDCKINAYTGMSAIRFRDPKKVEDKDGYEKAKVLLDAKYTDVKDTIIILAEVDGLKAVKEFETWTV